MGTLYYVYLTTKVQNPANSQKNLPDLGLTNSELAKKYDTL